MKTSKALAFRVNRDVVVLNDTANGDTYLTSNMSVPVNNWKDITRQLQQREEKRDSATKTLEATKAPERGQQNRPPVAVADEFGVRAGGTAALPVLDNDSDPDGDVLTATPATQPSWGTVAAAAGGAALQVTVPPTASGSATFEYLADDGNGGTAKAGVTLAVHPRDVNEAPKQRRVSAVQLESGKEIAVNALQGWIDPDGDAMLLQSATAPEGMSVRLRADGSLWVRDLGVLGPGRREVKIVVGDGRKEAGGVVTVEVLKGGNVAPVANADRATVFVGRAATVRPLVNDTDANGDVVHLSALAPAPAGVTATPDYQAGTVSLTATKAGEYYVGYTITDGPTTSTSFIRVSALDPRPGATPIAGADTVLLPAGGTATADVLANDVDPGGGVLLVRSVTLPAGGTLLVQVVDHGVLRIEAPGGLTAPATFDYAVTNGTATATGRVTVVPTPAAAAGSPPITAPDQALVRAGDIVTIPVLANDSSPVGLRLALAPDVAVRDPGLGQAFVSDGVVRFRAGGQAGTTTLTYTAVDALGQVASGTATVTIRGAGEGNVAPVPRALTARVLAGMTTRIHVPLDGVDPDGDSVTLAGLASGPTKGTAAVAGDVIEYTAPSSASGTDAFTYALQDAAGGRGTGTIQVGIAPVGTTNAPPVVRPDRVVARPGRALAIPVLANDTDPDGDTLSLVPDSVQAASSAAAPQARAEGSRVVVETPAGTGVLAYYYEADDGHGGRTRGGLTVDVRPDAPLLPPTAADDVVAAGDVAGRDSVEVDVLKNDDDPDGDVRRLQLRSDDPGVRVAGGKLVVPVGDQRRVFLYSVTDPDGLTARAAVFVPARAGQPPRLRDDRFPLRVKAGETLTVRLADVVIVRDGRSPRVTSEAAVSAAAGSNGKPLVADLSTLTYTSTPTFRGLTSLNAEITDGADAKDGGALVATVSMPIVVEGPGGTPPTVRPSEIVLTPGQPAKRVDLGPSITDPDPGDAEKAKVTLGAVSAGFAVALEGRVLVASAAADAKDGQTGTAEITVTDGSTEPVKASVPLRAVVVPENRPPMVVTPAVISDVRPGETRDVDVTKYVTNPYADQGKPLTLVGAPAVSSGSGTATASGTTVRVAVAGDARGDVLVTYVVADASGKAERQAQGTIRLQLRVPPDPPTGVTAASASARSATVSWTSGAANGSPITRFTVSWAGGTKDCGTATTCVITGLSAGTDYAFTVVATSAYGDSKPSAPSNTIKLAAAKPTVPGVPTAKAGDKKVDLTWAPSTVEGGGSVNYAVQISPGGTIREATGTSLTWDGLTNGSSYTFTVQAKSGSETSAWTMASSVAVPKSLPGQVRAPTVTTSWTVTGANVVIRWPYPDPGGDIGPLRYEVRRSDGGLVTGCVHADMLCWEPAPPDGTTYVVRAKNSGGWGEWSLASAPYRATNEPPLQIPGPPTATMTQYHNGLGVISLQWPPPEGISETVTYEVRRSDGVDVDRYYCSQYKTRNLCLDASANYPDGLTYAVRAAIGQRVGPWSNSSAPLRVADYVPPAPTDLQVTRATGASTTDTLAWTTPAWKYLANYEVEARRTDGTVVCTSSGVVTQTSPRCVVAVPSQSTVATYQVRSKNMMGWGPWSAEVSSGGQGGSAPPQLINVRATPTGQDNQISISFEETPSAYAGRSYYWTSGSRRGSLPAGGGVVTDAVFVNGFDVPVTIELNYAAAMTTTAGPISVNAYGPPRPPVVKTTHSGSNVTITWDGSGSSNGRKVVAVYWRPYVQFGYTPPRAGTQQPITGGVWFSNSTQYGKGFEFATCDETGKYSIWVKG